MNQSVSVNNLHVSVDGKEVLNGVSLNITPGTVHVLMGPNGAGKSSLALALMGHPKYKITQGSIKIGDKNITYASPTERAKEGLFLSFQYPSEVTGVTVSNFLRTAYNAVKKEQLDVLSFYKLLKEKMAQVHLDESFAMRYLNEGFSGGEKKKTEILQLLILEPRYAILDETDSGVDVDALKVIAQGIDSMKKKGMGCLLITHYDRILKYVDAEKVSILVNGRCVKEGGKELIQRIETEGFTKYISKKEP